MKILSSSHYYGKLHCFKRIKTSLNFYHISSATGCARPLNPSWVTLRPASWFANSNAFCRSKSSSWQRKLYSIPAMKVSPAPIVLSRIRVSYLVGLGLKRRLRTRQLDAERLYVLAFVRTSCSVCRGLLPLFQPMYSIKLSYMAVSARRMPYRAGNIRFGSQARLRVERFLGRFVALGLDQMTTRKYIYHLLRGIWLPPSGKEVQPHLSPSLGVKDYICFSSKLLQALTSRLLDLDADFGVVVTILPSDMPHAFQSDVRYASLDKVDSYSAPQMSTYAAHLLKTRTSK